MKKLFRTVAMAMTLSAVLSASQSFAADNSGAKSSNSGSHTGQQPTKDVPNPQPSHPMVNTNPTPPQRPSNGTYADCQEKNPSWCR